MKTNWMYFCSMGCNRQARLRNGMVNLCDYDCLGLALFQCEICLHEFIGRNTSSRSFRRCHACSSEHTHATMRIHPERLDTLLVSYAQELSQDIVRLLERANTWLGRYRLQQQPDIYQALEKVFKEIPCNCYSNIQCKRCFEFRPSWSQHTNWVLPAA